MMVPGPTSPAGTTALAAAVLGFAPGVGLGVGAPLVAAPVTLALGPAVFTAAAFTGIYLSRR